MSAINFPLAAKRSKRFKRYSWNQVADGTFLPVSQAASRKHSGVGASMPANTSNSVAAPTLPLPSLPEQEIAGQGVKPTAPDAGASQQANAQKPPTEPENGLAEKKSANKYGKKRK
ncbi:hypothetical protein GGH95_001618, partial [Coemansia sp. RSA 1836]